MCMFKKTQLPIKILHSYKLEDNAMRITLYNDTKGLCNIYLYTYLDLTLGIRKINESIGSK